MKNFFNKLFGRKKIVVLLSNEKRESELAFPHQFAKKVHEIHGKN